VRAHGVRSLGGDRRYTPWARLRDYLTKASTEHILDVADAFVLLAPEHAPHEYGERIEGFIGRVRFHLGNRSSPMALLRGGVVPKSSDELHQEVVVPALVLLHDRPSFADVEDQYQDALEELSKQKCGDAVNGRECSVEATLRVILGLRRCRDP
jgi:hypothetical protein